MKQTRQIRLLAPLLIGACAAIGPCAAWAQAPKAWPQKPIRMVVAWPAGGPTDAVARIFAQSFSEDLGQPVVVDNVAGAGGNIGTEQVARATADGYTILFNTSAIVIAPLTYQTVRYDPLKDFAPIALTATAPLVLAVGKSSEARNVPEFIQQLKAGKGKMTYASSGVGAIEHLGGALFLSETGASAVHVPYRGTGPALLDLSSGLTDFSFTNLTTVLPFVRDGRLRALAVAAPERVGVLPDVPTMSETVLPGFEMSAWQGLVAPSHTPRDVLARLNKAVNDALKKPAVKSKLQATGVIPLGGTSERYAEYMRSEHVRWDKIVASTGARQ